MEKQIPLGISVIYSNEALKSASDKLSEAHTNALY